MIDYKLDNKRIAKNTIFLYFRMMVTMIVTLYTSRVVLQELGVDDFGIFQTVGGIVVMLSFISSALSSGSSRFLTYELGRGDFDRLKKTFSSTLSIHIILGLLICFIGILVGPYFVEHKLGLPSDRIDAALWVFYFSIITTFITIIRIPFTATLIAHEKMNVYAYVVILESMSNLLIVYLLQIGNYDKLIMYGGLLVCVILSITSFYVVYCFKTYKETRTNFKIDKEITRSIFGFSGWSLFASGSIALNAQGTNIITSMFFGPAVVTARAISIQVRMAAEQFINNFRLAANPQIVKLYAADDKEGSKKLLLNSTLFAFYLMLFIGLPIIYVAEPLLQLWLGVVPEYAVIFLQLIIIESLVSVFDTSFYTALYAKGQLKENALISPLTGFVRFPIVYFLFKSGCSPVVLSYAGIICYALLSFVIKPYLICKIADYTVKDIMSVFIPSFKVLVVSAVLPTILYFMLETSIVNGIVLVVASCASVLASVYYLGINNETRNVIMSGIGRMFPLFRDKN